MNALLQDPRPLVVHLVYRFDVGGLENGVANLIDRLPPARLRHAVVALTECEPAFCARVARPDVQFVSLHKPPGHGLQVYPALYRLFRAWRPAILHTRNLAALEAVVPAWFAGVPVRIHGEHGWDTADPDGRSERYRLLRLAYRPFVTRYIALSDQLRGYLKYRVGVPAERLAHICNGVDTARFRPAPAGRAAVEGSPFNEPRLVVIGAVGRLEAVKDPLNLVRAFALLLQRVAAPGLRLVLVGDGPLRGAVEAEVARAGLADRVWLAGARRDVPQLLRAMDLFALPSRAEGISNTVLEAMASGLPVVATDVGGNPELVRPGQTGFLVPARDPGAMADALARYVASPALAAAHGRAARLRAEAEFAIEGMVRRYADLYESLLAGAGQPALAM